MTSESCNNMWPFKQTNSPPIKQLSFKDESSFRQFTDAYFNWISETILTVSSLENEFVIDSKSSDIIALNDYYKSELSRLLNNSTIISDRWKKINRDFRYPSYGFSRSSFESTIKYNRSLLEEILRRADEPEFKEAERRRKYQKAGLSKKIFLVHGHDHEYLKKVSDFLTRLGLIPIVLHEQANQGKTIIEKFEANSDVGFAIIILTPDDKGASHEGANSGNLNDRARQNVILELGYFIARLGRERVCALKKGNVELPSDILGVVFIKFDERGAWEIEIAKELIAVGYHIDSEKLTQK